MYMHASAAGPSETGKEWEAPGVQRPGGNQGPRDARNYSQVGWPILMDTAEGTAGGEAKGGKRARGGSHGGEPRRNATRMQLAYCGCAVLRASGDLRLSIGCTPPQAPAYVL
jgi:hypothetical protein